MSKGKKTIIVLRASANVVFVAEACPKLPLTAIALKSLQILNKAWQIIAGQMDLFLKKHAAKNTPINVAYNT